MDDPPKRPPVIVADVAWTRIERDAMTSEMTVLVGRSTDFTGPVLSLTLPQSTYEKVLANDAVPLAAKRKVYQLRALATELVRLLAAAADDNS